MALKIKRLHVCDDDCRRKLLVKSHERVRVKRRELRLAKLHGKRPRIRRRS